MGETTGTNDKAEKKSFIEGLKAEFKKIIWPTQDRITKETITVVSVTVVLAAVIAVLDFIIKWGLSFII